MAKALSVPGRIGTQRLWSAAWEAAAFSAGSTTTYSRVPSARALAISRPWRLKGLPAWLGAVPMYMMKLAFWMSGLTWALAPRSFITAPEPMRKARPQ